MPTERLSPGIVLVAAAVVAACASSPRQTPAPAQSRGDTSQSVATQTYGSLRQEDISLDLQFTGVRSQAIPLHDSVIRLLAADAYRSLRAQLTSKSLEIQRARDAWGYSDFSIWRVSYYGLEPDARFSPSEVVITSAGRDYRPIEIIPLTAGFGRQSIGQRETQSALYLFDPAVNLNQPLEISMEGSSNNDWSSILRIIERERARLRPARVDTLRSPGIVQVNPTINHAN